MIDLLNQLFWNASLAGALAIAVSIAQRFRVVKCRPGLRHALWLIVVIKLVLPPMVLYPLGPSDLLTGATSNPPSQSLADIDAAALVALQVDLANAETSPLSVPSADTNLIDLKLIGWVTATASLLCSAILFVICIARVRAISRLIRHAEPSPPWVAQQGLESAHRLNLSCAPDVRVVDTCVTPFLWVTSKRPVIVIPKELVATLDRQSIALIISHELAHYSRRDHVTNSLVMLLGTLLWWNPIFWWARREMRLVQELCCDAMVLATDSSRRKEYAETLLRTVDFVASHDAIRTSPAPAFGSNATFRRRIEMICRSDLSAGTSTTVRVLTGALAVMLLSASPALGDQEDTKEESGKTVAQLRTELQEMNERLMKLDSLVERLLDGDAEHASAPAKARIELRRSRHRTDSDTDDNVSRDDDSNKHSDHLSDPNQPNIERRIEARRPANRRVERSVRIRARGVEDVKRQMQETERELEAARDRGDENKVAELRMKLDALAEAHERMEGKGVEDVVVIEHDNKTVNEIELEIMRNIEHGANVAEEAVEIAMKHARKQIEAAQERMADSQGEAQITIREMQRAAEEASRGAMENARERIEEVIQHVMKDVDVGDIDVHIQHDDQGHEDIDIDFRSSPDQLRKEKNKLMDELREREQVADLKRLVEELRQEIKTLRAEQK